MFHLIKSFFLRSVKITENFAYAIFFSFFVNISNQSGYVTFAQENKKTIVKKMIKKDKNDKKEKEVKKTKVTVEGKLEHSFPLENKTDFSNFFPTFKEKMSIKIASPKVCDLEYKMGADLVFQYHAIDNITTAILSSAQTKRLVEIFAHTDTHKKILNTIEATSLFPYSGETFNFFALSNFDYKNNGLQKINMAIGNNVKKTNEIMTYFSTHFFVPINPVMIARIMADIYIPFSAEAQGSAVLTINSVLNIHSTEAIVPSAIFFKTIVDDKIYANKTFNMPHFSAGLQFKTCPKTSITIEGNVDKVFAVQMNHQINDVTSMKIGYTTLIQFDNTFASVFKNNFKIIAGFEIRV